MIEWFKKPVQGFTYRNWHLALDLLVTVLLVAAVFR